MKELVCRFGVPLYIHSDQGRNFESAVFGEMCNLLGMTKTRTTPLHPQSDGMVEHFNRTLEAQLSMFVEDHQRDWDQLVPLMLMAYRTAVHETTGCTPASLMFGRDLKLPIDILYGRPETEHAQHTTSYALKLQDRLEKVHHFARQHLQVMSNRMKRHYDNQLMGSKLQTQVMSGRMKRHYDNQLMGSKLQVGTAVWLYNPHRRKGITPKLMRNWQGPYVVIKCINDLVYRIQLGPKSKPKVVHRNSLWSYTGHNPPTWFSNKTCVQTMAEDHRQSCTVENGQSCLTQEEEQEPVVEKELCQLQKYGAANVTGTPPPPQSIRKPL